MAQSSRPGLGTSFKHAITGWLALGATAWGTAQGSRQAPMGGYSPQDHLGTALAPQQHRTLQNTPRPATPDCDAMRCFDASRCASSHKVFVYPQAHARLDRDDHGWPYYGYLPREPREDDPLYTRNPEEACLLAVYMWSIQHDYNELPTLPHWNGGQNHILIDFTDPAFAAGAPGDVIGRAMLAKSYLMQDQLRPGFDMSVPILKLSRAEANVRAIAESGLFHHDARKYFLTFKGSVYRLGTAGSYRWNLENFGANETDVNVRLQCFKLHGWHLEDAHRDHCNQLDEAYAQADYIDLTNTTFALVPGGRQPGSYRLTEALGAASIPVFLNPDVSWVRPYEHAIDWSKISLTFRPGEEAQILPALRGLSDETVAHMRQGVREVYNQHFGTPEKMARNLYDHAINQVMPHGHRHHDFT